MFKKMNSRRNLWTAKLLGRAPTQLPKFAEKTHFSGIILGIDPSLRGTGLGVIEVLKSGDVRRLDSLTLKISPRKSFVDCLGQIFSTTNSFFEKYDIQAVGLEETIYVQNFKVAHILGSARGACLSAVALRNVPVKEFPPLRIKKSVVGIGQATKFQVSKMVAQILHLSEPLPPDESDAIAAALCYFFSLKSLIN